MKKFVVLSSVQMANTLLFVRSTKASVNSKKMFLLDPFYSVLIMCLSFSVFIFHTPEYDGTDRIIGQIVLEKVFSDFYDDTTSVDWTDDSR